MRTALSVAFVALIGHAQAAVPDSALEVVKARLRTEMPNVQIVVSDQECSEPPNFRAESDFRSAYPDGVVRICDIEEVDTRLSLKALRYLFNASRGEPLIAKEIDVHLVKRQGLWRIKTWTSTHIDYSPPPPTIPISESR